MKNYFYISFIILLSVLGSGQAAANVQLENLRCEMLQNPEGIDVTTPRLSWEITGKQRNIEQTAYQVLVASTPEKLAANEGDLWNSGKVNASQSVHVQYAGKRLNSRDECYWKVKTWTSNGESSWSAPAYWSMGLLHYGDWVGRWIGMDKLSPWDQEERFSRLSARYFRKEFEAPKEIKKAKVYIIGLGLYELYLNGQRIGDQVLAPAPTDYSENVKYNTFDVTKQLKSGKNAIGTVLGNGRFYTMRQYKAYKNKTFGYPKMLLNLVIEYTDGTTEKIRTDESWKVTADGPIRTNNEYDGEEYDARKEMPGWNAVGFDAGKWLQAEYVQEPTGEFEAQMNEHMKVMETLKPVSVKQLKPGTYIVDMGQNMVGWLKMKVQGKSGDKVTFRFAEVLNEKGEVALENVRDAKVTDVYTLKGGGEEVWEPSFVFHGFRYVEVSGFPGKATVNNFDGQVVYDAMQTVGSFKTSNSIINQVYENSYWGIRGNYKGMPLDCPQRNERQPWLGDRPTIAYGESFIFDNGKLYAKWLDDIQYAQKADGSIPDVAPAFWRYYSDNMTWAGTYLMVADMLHQQYGNVKPIEKHYPSMKKWLQYMQNLYMDENYIMTKDSYGDWCAPPATIEDGRGMNANVKYPSKLISTAYHYYYLQMMQRFARLTGNEGDMAGYQALAEKVRAGFNDEFFNAEGAFYGENKLTDNLLALYFGLVPEEQKGALVNTIVQIIEVENKGHLSTGVVGTQWIMRSLTDFGRPDLAYKLATNTTYPSWGYMVANGATTIWELWNGNTAAPTMNSYNHVMMLGDLVSWYYEDLAGIKSSREQTGFKLIEMKPLLVDGLDFVNASYHSMYGLIKSDWKKEKKRFTWKISVPANTKAIVYIPASSEKNVTEGGKKTSSATGVKFLRMEGDRAVYELGSGDYNFVAK
ncbi:Bacterial alpha-L-rhamnosidase [Pontibacter qinzhouensis]|uniref:alpha-L-rhamnosidase n=1 Tax=Pontibacter qinzhouensis TaxID=2603253 RepID=A0A5C8J7I2_9BACT|nr:glycoside hydrolase family 78 protein [Pontibacter qinzhouensis]TXK33905.1 Bacterial alpha-L-rhamnosidase [Pontibacter qinzhouensis]